VETWRAVQRPDLLKQLDHVCVAFATCDAQANVTGLGNDAGILGGVCPRTYLAFGGWDNCTNFSAVIGDPALRQQLAQNLVSLCKTLRFQGVDVDWEYPSSADVGNLVLFAKSIKTVSGNTLGVSLAVPANNPDLYEPQIPQLVPLIDAWHVMTYDYVGPWTGKAGYNSDLLDGQYSMGAWASAGAPHQKLWLGSAWYGRAAKVSSVASLGGYGELAKFLDGDAGEPTYATIAGDFVGRGDWLKTHPAPGTAWLSSASLDECISFEDPQAVREKVSWAQEQGYGGVFCWSWGQDTATADLVQALLA
jgi:chitinase